MLLQVIGSRQVRWKMTRASNDLHLNNNTVHQVDHGLCATRDLRTTDHRCIPHTIMAIVLSVTTDRHVYKKPYARMLP